MKNQIALPTSKNEFGTYKRLPLVVKAFQWHGWDANYDPFNKLVPFPYLILMVPLYKLYRWRGRIETDPRTMAVIEGVAGIIKPGYWILEHGKNRYEVLTNKQFLKQYQKCEFVSQQFAEWMIPGKAEEAPYDSESPEQEVIEMSHKEGLIKASDYQCPTCNNTVNPATSDWIFEDGVWKHYHGYLTGWVTTKKRI